MAQLEKFLVATPAVDDRPVRFRRAALLGLGVFLLIAIVSMTALAITRDASSEAAGGGTTSAGIGGRMGDDWADVLKPQSEVLDGWAAALLGPAPDVVDGWEAALMRPAPDLTDGWEAVLLRPAPDLTDGWEAVLLGPAVSDGE